MGFKYSCSIYQHPKICPVLKCLFSPKFLQEILCFFLELSFKEPSLYGGAVSNCWGSDAQCILTIGDALIQMQKGSFINQFVVHTSYSLEHLRHTGSIVKLTRTSILTDERGYKLSPKDKDYNEERKNVRARMNLQGSAVLKYLKKKVVNWIGYHL